MKKHETYCSYVNFALLGCMSVFRFFSHMGFYYEMCPFLKDDFLTA